MASWSSARPASSAARCSPRPSERLVHAVVTGIGHAAERPCRLSPHTVEPLAQLFERLQADAIVNGTGRRRRLRRTGCSRTSNRSPRSAMRMAAPAPGSSTWVGRRVRRGALRDRRGCPARRIHALCRREGGRVRAADGGGRVGHGRGSSPRLRPDRCEDARHVPPGAGSPLSAAAASGAARVELRTPRRRAQRLRRPARCRNGRPPTGVPAAPRAPPRQRRERAAERRQGPCAPDRRARGSGEIDKSRERLSAVAPPVSRSPTSVASAPWGGSRPSRSTTPSTRSLLGMREPVGGGR